MPGTKIANSGRKPASMKEATFGRLPQRGRAAAQPSPFWESFMEVGFRPEFAVFLARI